jgi:hypothetical protein
MGTATVETLTIEQAKDERARLLQGLGLSPDDLEDRARNGLLDAEEYRVWRHLRTLNWLLAEDA